MKAKRWEYIVVLKIEFKCEKCNKEHSISYEALKPSDDIRVLEIKCFNCSHINKVDS